MRAAGRTRVLLLGQLISLLITGTGVFSELLSRKSINAPAAQSLLNYVLLSGFAVWRAFGLGRWRLQTAWWKYALLAFTDVQGNYLVVKAYQYTSITSVMLLDCFTIPFAMALSRLFLRTRYSLVHLGGVALCLAGLVLLIVSDAGSLSARGASGRNALVGDLLCIAGSFLYAVTNVGQEALVKRFDKSEYLGSIGVFGTLVSCVQLALLERSQVASLDWRGPVPLYMAGFAACLFSMYASTSSFLSGAGDATLLNLSLLTSDMWAVAAGTWLFHEPPQWLYYPAFALVGLGVYVFGRAPVHYGDAELERASCEPPDGALVSDEADDTRPASASPLARAVQQPQLRRGAATDGGTFGAPERRGDSVSLLGHDDARAAPDAGDRITVDV